MDVGIGSSPINLSGCAGFRRLFMPADVGKVLLHLNFSSDRFCIGPFPFHI
jgi:hypothetical protein